MLGRLNIFRRRTGGREGGQTRVVAYYLPQFHPIPENDEWWGKGFTEWTNVAKAKPLFPGHHQPHLPSDLGFYDLRVPEVRAEQAELARKYGIEGFCYWHYWFAGKRLLERPFNEVLSSGEPDFPFCLAWANATWSGIWHGCPDRILIEQTYPEAGDYERHFYSLLNAFGDDRYMTIDGRKVFVVYKPRDIPEPRRFTDCWRELAEKEGLKGLYFIGSIDHPWDSFDGGFDALTTNPPVSMVQKAPGAALFKDREGPMPEVYSYSAYVENAFPKKVRGPEYYPCVVPNWDNTPRSGVRGVVLQGSTPELFGRLLEDAAGLVADREPDRRVVFIKSWNEWAEGNYLEPDMEWGRGYLEETLRAVKGAPRGL